MKLEDCLKKLRTSEGGGFSRFNERHLIQAARSQTPQGGNGLRESQDLVRNYLSLVDDDLKKVTTALNLPTESAVQPQSTQAPQNPAVAKARAVVDSKRATLPSAAEAWVGTREEMLADPAIRQAFIQNERSIDPDLTEQQASDIFDLSMGNPRMDGVTFKGRTYIIADGVSPTAEDGSFEGAIERILRHEDTHISIDSVTQSNPKRKKEWEGLKKRVSPEKLDNLAKRRYPMFTDWRKNDQSFDSLAHEYFAEQMERDAAGETVDDRPLLEQFIAYMKKVLARVTGREVSLEEIREFVRAGREARAREMQTETRSSARASSQGLSKEAAERDAAYMAAVERGDMETAQKMVDEAANKAGYTTGPVYHGTNREFNQFEPSKIGSETDDGFAGKGFYFTSDKSGASAYGKRLVSAFLNIKNPYNFGANENFDATVESRGGPEGFSNWLRSNGYDGSTLWSQTMALDPSQIKSADPVTRDDSGQIIPLSQRFNTRSSDIRFSLKEGSSPMPKGSADLITHKSPYPGMTSEKIADYAWPRFYAAWKSNLENPDAPLTSAQQAQLEAEWKANLADENAMEIAADHAYSEERMSKADFGLYSPKPSQTAPETGARPAKKKSKTPEPTAEDIARRFPRFSLKPQDPVERLNEINQAFSYQTQAGQKEGLDPTKATEDKRIFASDGTPVDFSRQGMTNVQQEALAKESIDLLSTLSPDGKSKTFGKDLMAYMSGSTNSLYGQQLNDLQQASILNYLDGAIQDRAQMGIDGAEVQRVRSQKLSRAGALLQTAASSIYEPLRDIAEKAKTLTDKKLKEEGVDPVKLDAEIKAAVTASQTEVAKDISTPEVKASILDGAQNDVDDLWEIGLEGMDPKVVSKVRQLDEWVVRLGELRKLEKMLSSAPKGAKASLAAIPDNLTLEQVRALIADGEAEVKKLTEEIGTAKKKDRRKAKESQDKEKQDNATFSAWVNGAESKGVDSFDDLMLKYIDPNGFNREAFTTVLTNSFKQADPNFISGVVNRVADLLDGAATEEGVAADAAKAPNYNAKAKRLVGTEIAHSATPEVMQVKKDPFTDLTKQRLKGEISAENFQKELVRLGLDEETAFAYLQKVDQDRARIGDAQAQRELNAQAKKDMAAFKREAETNARKTEATISQLSKEFSDTWSQTAKKDVDAYKALLNNFIGVNGPPISEEQFIEEAKKLNIPEEGYTRLMGVLDMQRKRAVAVADAKAKQKAAEKAASEAKKESEKSTKEAEAKIAALAKEFSDTLPAKSKEKDLTALQRLMDDYTGKRGPAISDEAFENRATELNIPEGVLDRLRGVLQMQRKREALAADTKARQAEAERLEKERLQHDREAQRDIDRLAVEFSDTLAAKKTSDISELKKVSNSFLGKEGPPISSEEFLSRLEKLNVTPQKAQNLLKLLQESRRRDAAVRYAKAVQKAAESKQKAIESAVKKLVKSKTGNQTKLRQQSTFVKGILGALEGGILESESIRQAFAEAYELHGLTPEVLKDLGARLQQINAMKEGMVKETLLLQFNQTLNAVAPTSSFSNYTYGSLMGYILGAVSTLGMQITGLNRFINPLAGTVETLFSLPGTTTQKVGRTINPMNLIRVYMDGLAETWQNVPQTLAGASGIASSTGYGVGMQPSSLAAVVPREMSMSYVPWGQISKYRFNTPKLLKAMGLEKAVNLTKFSSWMASRSFQTIRGAEGWVGGTDKNTQFKRVAVESLMKQGKTFDEAWNMVQEAVGPKNAKIWEDAGKQADKEIAEGLVSKFSKKQRQTELAQDFIDEQWNLDLKNRYREQAALAGYKQDPISPLGAWMYSQLSSVFNNEKNLMSNLKFSFLFARFFSNAIESAYFRTPIAGLMALGIKEPTGAMTERQQRIVQIFGSMDNYRDVRLGRAASGTAILGTLGALMIYSLRNWDPDDDEPPGPLWLTGDPIGEFGRKAIMESNSWWRPNTLYIFGKPVLNFVNASPEYAMVGAFAGNVGDRFMFDKLLNMKKDTSTDEWVRSDFQSFVAPFRDTVLAPWSRSTYQQWFAASEALFDGDGKKFAKLFANPFTGAAASLTIGAIPSVKTLEKVERMQYQPKAPKDIPQAIASSVPFANTLGLDMGQPMVTPFGEETTGFPFFSLMVNPQEVTETSRKAANLLAQFGITKLGTKEKYIGDGTSEVFNDGKRYLLSQEQRGRVLRQIGQSFAAMINANADKLRRLEKTKGKDAVSDEIDSYAKKARSRVLFGMAPARK
jgi:hypothetical protein